MRNLAYHNLEAMLWRKLKMTFTARPMRSFRLGHELELGVFAYNDEAAIIVEVSTIFSQESLAEILYELREFPQAFPDHADKKLYGIVAAVDIPENMRQRVLKHGLYLARIGEETFRLAVPRGFRLKTTASRI